MVLTHGAGLAVHQQTVLACRVTPEPLGQPADGRLEVQECGTLTRDVWAVSDWWSEAGVPHGAMERTGEDWPPVDNLLAGTWTVLLVNAAPVPHVPGRQTAQAEARWLATLLRHGVWQARLIPPAEPRDRRDLMAAAVGATGAVGRAAAPAPPAPPMTCARAVTVLDTMPGVQHRGGALWVAAWGIAMARCGTAARLAAWRGVAPGHDERAGPQRAGKTRQGHRALRTGLPQWAHAAACTQATALSALSHRLAARRGKQRALMAVAHSIVVSAFSMRSRNASSHACGANDVDAHRRGPVVDRLTRRLQHRGYRVRRDPVPAA